MRGEQDWTAGLDSRAAKTGKAGAGGDNWHGLKPRECAEMRGEQDWTAGLQKPGRRGQAGIAGTG